MVEEDVSLYFHIPFCTKKCPYCHFYVIPNKPLFQEIYTTSITLEWERIQPLLQNKKIVSIYFGGGTPTLFAPDGIAYLLKLIGPQNCEITIEANPEECTLELFQKLFSLGINRLSLGVQSLDDRSLSVLERQHSAKKAIHTIFAAHEAGIKNISIDLMYDLPDQTEASWQYTLSQLQSLPITHLSLYNLTIEPHTSFSKRKLNLPSSKTSLKLLQSAVHHLEDIGLKRYEISAFAKPGFESRHNLGYWTARPFLGLGPSAFSYWQGERFRNIANLHAYAKVLKEGKSPIDFKEKLPYPANIKELLAVRLRLLEGADFPNPLPEETKKAIEKWVDDGSIATVGNRIKLTDRGRLFYDLIATDLI